MKFKIVVNHIFHTEREVEFDTRGEAVAYAEALQNGDVPDDAVRSDEMGVHDIDG